MQIVISLFSVICCSSQRMSGWQQCLLSKKHLSSANGKGACKKPLYLSGCIRQGGVGVDPPPLKFFFFSKVRKNQGGEKKNPISNRPARKVLTQNLTPPPLWQKTRSPGHLIALFCITRTIIVHSSEDVIFSARTKNVSTYFFKD